MQGLAIISRPVKQSFGDSGNSHLGIQFAVRIITTEHECASSWTSPTSTLLAAAKNRPHLAEEKPAQQLRTWPRRALHEPLQWRKQSRFSRRAHRASRALPWAVPGHHRKQAQHRDTERSVHRKSLLATLIRQGFGRGDDWVLGNKGTKKRNNKITLIKMDVKFSSTASCH